MNNKFNRYSRKIRTILDIIRSNVTVLGLSAPSYTTITRWAKRFREGREDVSDHHLRSASPVSNFTGENIQLVRQVISNGPHSTYDEIIAETSLSHGTIERIIHDCFKTK